MLYLLSQLSAIVLLPIVLFIAVLLSCVRCSYVKYDLCGQGNLQPFVTFQVMRDALNATGRPMLYSCEPQQLRGDPIEWPPYIANMFRIAADMGAYYGLFTGDALLSNAWVNVAEQGGWTDAGYLEVGNVPGLVNISMSRTQFALYVRFHHSY